MRLHFIFRRKLNEEELWRQNTNCTRQIGACKRILTVRFPFKHETVYAVPQIRL
jgi:hypothetical protein